MRGLDEVAGGVDVKQPRLLALDLTAQDEGAVEVVAVFLQVTRRRADESRAAHRPPRARRRTCCSRERSGRAAVGSSGLSCSRFTTAWVMARLPADMSTSTRSLAALERRHLAEGIDLIDTGVGPGIGQQHKPGVDQQADTVSHAGNSTSLLLLQGRLGHQHVGFHLFSAAALAHAAHRRRIEIIAPDGEPAVGAHRGPLVGHIDALPADVRRRARHRPSNT